MGGVGSDSAEWLAEGIGGRRHIGNRPHHVGDVIMNEDRSGIRNPDAAAGMSVFGNIAMSIVRGDGSDSVKAASVFFAANVSKLFDLIRT